MTTELIQLTNQPKPDAEVWVVGESSSAKVCSAAQLSRIEGRQLTGRYSYREHNDCYGKLLRHNVEPFVMEYGSI